MMLRLLTQATEEPVTLEFVKALLRIDHSALDAQLPTLITMARELVERQTGYALAIAEYEWTPVGERVAPLPIKPATVLSLDGVRPISFRTEPGTVPEALRMAVTMLVADFINKPEATSDKILSDNPALKRILFSFREVLP